jgi:AcrR family transcriptional regulator
MMAKRVAIAGGPAPAEFKAFVSDRSVDAELRIKMGAVYLFATRGYAATTIRDICALVNLTTAGVYHHVENKESLLVDIMRSGQQALNATAETALVAARNPAERLAVLVTSLTGSHGKNLMMSRVTDGELRSLDGTRGALDEILSLRDAYESHWRSALDDGLASGDFSAPDAGLLRLALMAMCTGTSNWFRPSGRKSLSTVCENFVEMALTLSGTDTASAVPRTSELVPLTLTLVPRNEWEPSSVMGAI